MNKINIFIRAFVISLSLTVVFVSCEKKEEAKYTPPEEEITIDKEKELKEREEFERLKRLQEGITDSSIAGNDSLLSLTDSAKVINDSLKKVKAAEEKKKMVQKEKELNKRLDNPVIAINDYIEYLKRGTGEGGNFEQNMKKANGLWQNGNLKRFTSNYKNTKKITTLEEPKVISQKGNEAVVEVKIKKADMINNKEEESVMTVRYNLIADNNGKWKIKNNTVIKNK
ncbi:MAG TPA: hypothetical protein PK536_13195 [Ignavibacteria bacterium]|nr:hypothetical protein [Ignavibacteria bacterium]HRJ98337.1 hypothetical protein [Ignavibacteria bacterium]